MKLKKHLPNLLTLGNLFFGSLAIVAVLQGRGTGLLVVCFLGALLCDFLDGLLARALGVSSAIGKDLDSLSDMVSFGLLPGILVFQMISLQFPESWSFENNIDKLAGFNLMLPEPLAFTGFLIPLLSALRLAKFNHDTRQSLGFIGLPTPANALFFFSLYLIFQESFANQSACFLNAAQRGIHLSEPVCALLHPYVLAGLSLLFSLLLVSEIPLLSFKFKNFSWKENKGKYLLILLSTPPFVFFTYRSIPFLILLYFIISFFFAEKSSEKA